MKPKLFIIFAPLKYFAMFCFAINGYIFSPTSRPVDSKYPVFASGLRCGHGSENQYVPGTASGVRCFFAVDSARQAQ